MKIDIDKDNLNNKFINKFLLLSEEKINCY